MENLDTTNIPSRLGRVKAAKPLSEARRAANRENAKKSTGPRTEAGKRRSSQNALVHGLTARHLTPLGEVSDALATLEKQFLDSWNPQTHCEASLVKNLASIQLRVNRLTRVEAGCFDSAMSPITPGHSSETVNGALARAFMAREGTFTLLSRYAANTSREYDRTLKQLLSVRKQDLAPTGDGPEFFDETKPFLVENTEQSPPKEAIEPSEPNIRSY